MYKFERLECHGSEGNTSLLTDVSVDRKPWITLL